MILPGVHQLGRILSLMLNLIIGLSKLLDWILLGGREVQGLGLRGEEGGGEGLRLLMQGGERVLGL